MNVLKILFLIAIALVQIEARFFDRLLNETTDDNDDSIVEDELDVLFLFPPINTVSITKQDISSFKDSYALKDDIPLKIQEIPASNSFTVNDKRYDINDLDRVEDIFTPDFEYRMDGVEQENMPDFNVFSKESGRERILVMFRENVIENILISNKDTGATAAELIHLRGRYLVTIMPEDIDIEKYSEYILAEPASSQSNTVDDIQNNVESFAGDLEELVEDVVEDLRDSIEAAENIFFKWIKYFPGLYSKFDCQEYQMVEISVSFESTFCNEEGGADRAFEKAAQMVAAASMRYQQKGLCRKIQMSQMDGYCADSTDPYANHVLDNKSGCYDEWGLLNDFREYSNANNTEAKRDASILFSGTALECSNLGCVVGCAFIKSLCQQEKGYAVVDGVFTESIDYRSVLVAHELGHIMGATHQHGSSGKYVMEAAVKESAEMFSRKSIRLMNRYMRDSTCPGRTQAARAPREERRAQLLKRLYL